MDCTCAVTNASDYSSSLLNKKVVTAKKAHVCGECRRTIATGQDYEYYAGISEGSFFTAKTCLDCISLRNIFFCDGYMFESLWDDMCEHVYACGGDISESAITELTSYALGRVCDMIEKTW